MDKFLTYKLVNKWKERTHADTFKTHEETHIEH